MLRNREQIIELLNADDDFINALMSRGGFDRDQLKDVIETSADNRERSARLVDMLLKGSIGNFNHLIACVNSTQPHIAPFLTGETGWISYRLESTWFI